MSTVRIEPRVLKGFRDTLPNVAIVRNQMISVMQQIFSSFGFVPIDTPALELSEILLGKGSDETDKQMYRFKDNGERDVALRFDLTVPFARFTAMHIQELGTPFKRFHIAPVWRAEKPQRGRYREFIQCDVDTIGTNSPVADAEIVAVIRATLSALKINHKVRLNNRKLLNGLLARLDAENRSTPVLRAIDKLEKLGEDVVQAELMTEAKLSQEQVSEIFEFLKISKSTGSLGNTIALLKSAVGSTELGAVGVNELEVLCTCLDAASLVEDNVSIDVSIARGLDYYTGTIFETVFADLPEIGSICSGGRYDNLASLYTKQNLPGVGTSFGLDRIIAGLEETKRLSSKTSTADVLVTLLDETSQAGSFALAQQLRKANLNVEQSLSIGKLGNQLKYANKKQIPIVVIFGEAEQKNSICLVKDLRTGEQKEGVPLITVANIISELLDHPA